MEERLRILEEQNKLLKRTLVSGFKDLQQQVTAIGNTLNNLIQTFETEALTQVQTTQINHNVNRNWAILIVGRRPLSIIEDENEKETFLAIKNTLNFLLEKCSFLPDHIFVLTSDTKGVGSERKFGFVDTICDNDHERKMFSQVNFRLGSPVNFVDAVEREISGTNNNLFLFYVGHGACDRNRETFVERTKRGTTYYLQPHIDSLSRWWLLFPHAGNSKYFAGLAQQFDLKTSMPIINLDKNVDTTSYSLHWQELAKCFHTVSGNGSDKFNQIVFLVGACYSGGLFQWIPDRSDSQPSSNSQFVNDATLQKIFPELSALGGQHIRQALSKLPLYAMTSSDFEYMSGTWFWHQWLKHMEELESTHKHSITLSQFYAELRNMNPTQQYDTRYGTEARGETTDAVLVSQFGNPSLLQSTWSQVLGWKSQSSGSYTPSENNNAVMTQPTTSATQEQPSEALSDLQQLFENVRIENWYQQVYPHTFKTVFVPLSIEQAKALLKASKYSNTKHLSEYDQKTLRTFGENVENIIKKELGGQAFIKISHRSPKDATLDSDKTMKWFADHKHEYENSFNGRLACIIDAYHDSMKVSSGKYAIELLTSSERIAEDLEWALAIPHKFNLQVVLREWIPFNCAMEFRGLVCNGELRGISQYHYICHYPVLAHLRDDIGQRVYDFFNQHLKEKISCIKSERFIMDFYVEGVTNAETLKNANIRVIELNPWETSDFFLFHAFKDEDLYSGKSGKKFEIRATMQADPNVMKTGNVYEGWSNILNVENSSQEALKKSRDNLRKSLQQLTLSHAGMDDLMSKQQTDVMVGSSFSAQDIVNIMNRFPQVNVSMQPSHWQDYKFNTPKQTEFINSFCHNIREHGYAVIRLTDEECGPLNHMFADLKTFMEKTPEEQKYEILLDAHDCGYAFAPEMFEQFKFVYTANIYNRTDYPWPKTPASFKHSIIQYYHLMDGFTRQLVEVMGKGFGFDPNNFFNILDQYPLQEGQYSNGDMRLFRYFKAPAYDQLYAGEIHADIGVITVVPISTQNGLQVFDRKTQEWILCEGSDLVHGKDVVCFCGDVTRALTGGFVPAAPHRVKLSASATADRYSMPFILRPRDESPIKTMQNTQFDKMMKPKDISNYESYTKFYQAMFKTCLCSPNWRYLPPY